MTNTNGHHYTTTVSEAHQGERLDKYLSHAIPDISRTRAQQLLENDCVSKDGHTIRDGSYRVKPGECFSVHIPEAEPTDMRPADIPLSIVYEDNDFLVIDKPVGMTVHPGAGNHQDTLANALLAHCGDSLSGIGGVTRPGIVHRIDKDTSGLLVVAKHDVAHRNLAEQISTRTLKRRYLALCWGMPSPKKGTIEGNIGRNPKHRQKMAVLAHGGKSATTHYEVKKCFGLHASLIACQLETGRTHQIRVHMTEKGHPLIGDQTYGSSHAKHIRQLSPELQDFIKNHFKRQALHAASLSLLHPVTGEKMEFESPLPEDMQRLIKLFEAL